MYRFALTDTCTAQLSIGKGMVGLRLFVAIELSESVKNALCGAMDVVRRKGVSGKYTPRENLHLTLAFIGESNDVDKLCAAIDELRIKPFTICVDGMGAFGDILWAGVKQCTVLERLAYDLQCVLRAKGFELEKRGFVPHITLVRKASIVKCSQVQIKNVQMPVRSITLMRSDRVNGKMKYTPVYVRYL